MLLKICVFKCHVATGSVTGFRCVLVSLVSNKLQFHFQFYNKYTCTPTIVAGVKVDFHYPSSRPEFTGRQLGPSTRAVNSGSGNRP